ncbi:TetR/AcrR family transcriptional regulator [Salinibacterium sp. NG253]|uniref:TetR/AcrR family transcriptional regulator n=1 Tax=Salinibacterium sp. NG253 TaxID=2792039 RepID=UPI0018CDF6E6|nr:TetR/AcrR family transcriptional regulator [Salinibacterium sp. NG253]MBH0117305.1 TetR/AcrR family transcriptional regulator [Salinibacterium sp. NG253]
MSETKPMSAAGQRILVAAGDLFYGRGITAVGVDLIAEHSGVTKRTLYNQFGSKDQLVVAYIEEREQRWRLLVRETIAAASPMDAVLAPLEALRTWNQSNPRGCAFINALAELPDPAHPAHLIATQQKQWLLTLFTDLATAAGCSAPDTLATQLLVLHEGALVTQQLPLDTLSASIELAHELVRASILH